MLKKLVASALALLAGMATYAQTFTVTPRNPTAEDRITITVDVTGFAALENESPLYVWAWSNLGDAPNGQWTSSNETARMTQDPTNPKKWSFSFVPATYYGFPAGGFQFVGFLVKGKDGSGTPERKTADQRINLDPIAFVDAPVRAFPAKFRDDDLVTIFYDKTLDNNVTMKNTENISIFTQVRLLLPDGTTDQNWVYTTAEWPAVGNEPKLAMSRVAGNDSLYRWTIKPSKFFPLQPGEEIAEIKIHVRSAAEPDFSGATGPAASKGDVILITQRKRR